eukprot:s3514_g3.t1
MADSKMQYKIMSRRPQDLSKGFSVCSGWSKLGIEANERALACFRGDHDIGYRFFLTLSPMVAFKFKLDEVTEKGIVAIREKTGEVMLAKPVRGPYITLDLDPPVAGFYHYTFTYTFSASLAGSGQIRDDQPMFALWAKMRSHLSHMKLHSELDIAATHLIYNEKEVKSCSSIMKISTMISRMSENKEADGGSAPKAKSAPS